MKKHRQIKTRESYTVCDICLLEIENPAESKGFEKGIGICEDFYINRAKYQLHDSCIEKAISKAL